MSRVGALRARTVDEDRQARREPVQEVPPAHGAELARAEEPRERRSAQGRVHDARVVIGFGEQSRTSPVAREQQRAGRSARRSATCSCNRDRSSSSAVAASRTWKRTLSPTSTRSPTASAPESGSTPSTPRIRKSPWPCSLLYSSITRPTCSPFAASSRSGFESDESASSRRSSGGRPPSSRRKLSRARVTTNVAPNGRHPWETSVVSRALAGSRTPTAPSCTTLVVQEERRLARARPATGHAADDDRAVGEVVQVPQQCVRRKGKGYATRRWVAPCPPC